MKAIHLLMLYTFILSTPSCEWLKKASHKLTGGTVSTGSDFLENNKNKENVKVTASGLQYEVIKSGAGKKPVHTDSVEVHYRGTLINGSEFDSSYRRNETITFSLTSVIAGWTEGLQLMQEGAKYRFYIPPNLAYGDRALPGIPADSVLIFDVELIKIKN